MVIEAVVRVEPVLGQVTARDFHTWSMLKLAVVDVQASLWHPGQELSRACVARP